MAKIKAFFGKIWAWVLAHKLIAGIIAGAFVVALTVAIVVPVSVSASRKKKAAQEQQSQQQQPAGDQGGGQQGGGEQGGGEQGGGGQQGHTHSYVFDQFIWKETPGDFEAQARYVCSGDASHEVFYDATVTLESTTAAKCFEDGANHWAASYTGEDGVHNGNKDEVLTARHYHRYTSSTAKVAGTVNFDEYVCPDCGECVYKVNDIYFSFKQLTAPTANENGKMMVRFFDIDETNHRFNVHESTDDKYISAEASIPAFIPYGGEWIIDTVNHEYLELRNNISLINNSVGNRTTLGITLIEANNMSKVMFSEGNWHYEVANLTSIIPEMIYTLNVYAGASYGSCYAGTTVYQHSFARKNGFTTPTEADLAEVYSGHILEGFSTTNEGPKAYDVNQSGIAIPETFTGSLNLYCLWSA